MPGYFINSGILFKQAKKAYQRTKDAPSDDAANQDDALVSILLAAAGLEAWIAEIALWARTILGQIGASVQLRALGDALEALESERASVKAKFCLARKLLTGTDYDKGALPFQDFSLLLSLRNNLVHMKPEEVPRTMEDERRGTEKLVAELSRRAACVPREPHVKSPWISRIATRSVAKWACNTAAHMTHSISEDLKQHVCHPKVAEMLARSFNQIA